MENDFTTMEKLVKEVDVLELELQDLCENQLPRLGATSPERTLLFNHTTNLERKGAKLFKNFNRLTQQVNPETKQSVRFRRFEKEEYKRLNTIQTRLETIKEQLKPDEVEEEYFRHIRDNTPNDTIDEGEDNAEEASSYGGYDELDVNQKPSAVVATVEALCDFQAEEDGDLSFQKGDIIEIIEKREDGWWIGRNKSGQAGVIPSTLVKIFSEENIAMKDDVPQKNKNADNSLSKRVSDNGGGSLWNKLKLGVNNTTQTSVSDVLQAMKAFPSGFRKPTLGLLYEDASYRTSSWIIPKPSASNISFYDLHWNNIDKSLRSVPSSVTRIFTLTSAKFVPNLSSGVKVLSRHAFISLWTEEKVVSNIHLVRGVFSERDASWNFNIKIGKFIASLYDGEFVVRTNLDNRKLSLLVELNYTYIRESTGEKSDICCGWASLPLFQADGTPAPNKNYEVKLHGGTPFERNVPLDRTLEQQAPSSLMQSLVRTNKQPKIIIKATSVNRMRRDILDSLPETIVTCHSYSVFIGFFRQHCASIFGKDLQIPSGTFSDPIMTHFPQAIDQSDLMDGLNTYWDLKTRLSLNRSQRRNKQNLVNLFKKCFLECVYPIMCCSRLPPYEWANERNERERIAFIQSYLQPSDVVSNLLSPNIPFKTLNVSKIAYNTLPKHSNPSVVVG